METRILILILILPGEFKVKVVIVFKDGNKTEKSLSQ